jgi:hypothetical protein
MSMGTMSRTSVDSPKKRKNTAAKRSRSGVSTRCACFAAGPEIAMPTRNAPTAAETFARAARPATRSVRPSTDSSRTSASFDQTRRDTQRPWRSAMKRINTTTASAITTEIVAAPKPLPIRSAVRTGR